MNKYNCSWCNKKLDSEEIESPRLSNDDKEIICDNCYEDKYSMTCTLCEDMFDKPMKVEDGYYFLITEDRFGSDTLGKNLDAGVYKIIKFPFFADGITEGFYYSDAFQKIRDLTSSEKIDIKEAGHRDEEVCEDCAKSSKNINKANNEVED